MGVRICGQGCERGDRDTLREKVRGMEEGKGHRGPDNG